MLFDIIDEGNWIPDELHTMLRISDILLQCAFYELSADQKKFAKISILIINEMKRIGVHFEFFPPITNSSSWTWTSLMGPDKLKVLQNFQIAKFFNYDRGQNIEYLWREFYRLYKIMRQQHLTDIEIDLFENNAKQWVRDFSRPTIGKPNSPNQRQGMYSKKNITPYMHMLTQHIPKFMRNLKNKGLSLRLFSTSSLEKKNHEHVRNY